MSASDSELAHAPWDRSRGIRHGSTIPAYVQLASFIRSEVIADQLPAGSPLPSEPELAGLYNVSRDTVRRAMAVLRELELIETRRGVGHYVTHTPERIHVNAGRGAVVSARLATPADQERLYGAGRYGWPVLVVEEPGQPPRIYDGTSTLVSFVDPRPGHDNARDGG